LDTEIRTKLDTAEAYNEHGLYRESLEIYTAILKGSTNLDSLTKKSVQAQIQHLEAQIRQVDDDDTPQELSSEEVSTIKKTWSDNEGAPEIIDSAKAFTELGLYKEAFTEYVKLLKMNYPVIRLFPGMSDCFFEIHSPSKTTAQLNKVLSKISLGKTAEAEIKFRFAVELEKKGNKDLALELYKAVKTDSPDYEGINEKIESIEGIKSYDSKYGYLLDAKFVTTAQLQTALALSKKTNKSVEFVLMQDLRVEKEQIGKSLASFYNCPFIEYDKDMPVPVELLGKLKKAYLLQNFWVPLNWEMTEGLVEILIDDPKNLEKTDNIYALINAKNIKFAVGIQEDIKKVIEHFYDGKRAEAKESEAKDGEQFDMMMDVEFEEDEEEDFEAEASLNETSSQIVRIVDQVIITAYRKGASDIHIEPSPATKKTNIRYRIDGVCQDVLKVPISNSMGILSRIKIMSGLDIAERRLPQDGKIKFKRKGVKPFELRVATLPTAGGFEDAVLRILADSGAMKINEMGLSDRNLSVLKRIITQPYGLILVVGPTGSGKTTTLHSAMGHINTPRVKIWTAEDPVEITQQGLRQVECKPKIGLDFARVMRAFLRADPDVIMIGEMRDYETASTGIEASLTGHLVLSTLHTNSAPETITRLLDMGLNPLNFSDAFLGVLAQRLVRRLCKRCREKYNPSLEEFNEIVTLFGKPYFDKTGITYSKDLFLYRAKGCDECSGTGYRGRLAIHELMDGTKDIKQMIKKQATTMEFFEKAAEDGMTTLIQDGILKSFEGLTDVTEVRRVCVS
jgi:type II secretory ATPase GspE/PulE/Tfp pilus assembly ATPase PilB-like protein